MNIKIFDSYNIRARLSVYIIIIAPIILTLYVLYEPIRSFTFSVVLIAIITSFSNYLFALQRYKQREKNHKNTAAEFLYIDDPHIDKKTKQRYYRKLSKIDKSFEVMNHPMDSEEFKQTCYSAVQWLRSNTRNSKLVQEENIMCGFYKNLISLKSVGIAFTIVAFFILIITSVPTTPLSFIQSKTNIILIFVDIGMILFWKFGVNGKIHSVLCEKYAYALLETLDTLPNRTNENKL
ncbi:hypothetical protein B5E92_08925 [Erysipelatoclostridium sp. An15]|uniref:hypothetical protein n=1 Tax=Erysipelatoclostridium sp. An15 TaxID=1965566 RepID=UPI000B370DA5|nr:hypothetical protein [Erysipelatoclostridium sp. An15]OUQ07216.1 hypothetical protein B5E92_08925 [Erysipelatoclostridium sp. An15]